MRCGQLGVRAPAVYLVDIAASRIYMQHMATAITVRDLLAGAPSDGVDGSMLVGAHITDAIVPVMVSIGLALVDGLLNR